MPGGGEEWPIRTFLASWPFSVELQASIDELLFELVFELVELLRLRLVVDVGGVDVVELASKHESTMG
jgi:uncharacterized protein YggT (Ycf19 family)